MNFPHSAYLEWIELQINPDEWSIQNHIKPGQLPNQIMIQSQSNGSYFKRIINRARDPQKR